jgi:hypothetical protein
MVSAFVKKQLNGSLLSTQSPFQAATVFHFHRMVIGAVVYLYGDCQPRDLGFLERCRVKSYGHVDFSRAAGEEKRLAPSAAKPYQAHPARSHECLSSQIACSHLDVIKPV